MAKYSFEFKMKVVQDYLQGQGSTRYFSTKYGIGNSDHKQVIKWIKAYQTFGEEGLMSSRKNPNKELEQKILQIRKENKIFQSMSRKGNCHDNAIMENFFGIMKQEMYYGRIYYSYEEIKTTIEKYIKYYNEQSIKEKLGWMSPVEYRCSLLAV